MSPQKIQLDESIALVKEYLLVLQNKICTFLESEENSSTKFHEDIWQHSAGGGGKTRVLEQGKIIEKAGVNFSHVFGNTLPQAATDKRPELLGSTFQALGVSVVVHPLNPYVPTTHFNVRFIVTTKANTDPVWWFGGGFDLTPYYGFESDCEHWHQTCKNACDTFGPDVYARYKKWCDNYFYLKHRKEPRGIGGLFFDDINEWGFAKSFLLIQQMGEHFIKAYQPIISSRKNLAFGKRERDFQLYRRGRYVEFNLLYDRGTLFGLQSGGRAESILMSLPPQVSWQYDWHPEKNSPEEKLYTEFLIAREWV